MEINNRKRRLNPFFVVIILIGILAVVYLFWFINTKMVVDENTNVENPKADEKNSSQITSVQKETPMRIIIDKIGVDAKILANGLDQNGMMETPNSLFDVGWYDQSARIGDTLHPILLSGHYGITAKPGIFHKLGELKNGDQFKIIGEYGVLAEYEIVSTESNISEQIDMEKIYNKDDDKTETAVLITCDGEYDPATFDYSNRLIVYAKRVK